MQRGRKHDRKVEDIEHAPDDANRSVIRDAVDCRMFTCSLIQYSGVVFPLMDPLRGNRHSADCRDAVVLCAREI